MSITKSLYAVASTLLVAESALAAGNNLFTGGQPGQDPTQLK